MKFTRSAFCIALLLAGSAHAQMYKWVGPDGKITYSDTPPPKDAAKVEKKNMGSSSSVDTSNMPYALADAVKNQPVTMYSGDNCAPCEEARNYLNKRGIPYKEKTVSSNADVAKLRELSGKQQLPFVTVGRTKLTGYDTSTWESALTSAGYPTSNMLPANYRNPQAEAAAPAPALATSIKKPEPTAATADTRPTDVPPATGKTPPGFRF